MTFDPKVNDGVVTVSSKTKSRNWVRSSPWPVPIGQFAPVNPYGVTRTWTTNPVASWDRTTKEVGSTCYSRTDYVGSLGTVTDGAANTGPPPVDGKRETFLNDRAMLAFLLKAKDQKSQIAVSLVEGRQTVNMIASAARDIAGLRRRWLSKQPRRTRGNERRLHSSWLEYRYGWMPLYYDAYGIAKHLSDLSTSQDTWPVRASATWDSDVTTAQDWNGFLWKGKVFIRTTHRYKSMVGGFITVDRRVDRELVRAGLTNPLELAWEVLPYSFVVDWFIKVGDYVEGMTALTGVSAHHCWASSCTDRAEAKSVGKTTFPDDLTIHGGGAVSSRRQDYSRWSVVPSLLSVNLTSLIDFDLQKQSWRHWVDAGALLKAAFRER
jgi:hypothetical protein